MAIQLLPGALGALAILAFVVSTVQSRPLRDGVVTDGTVASIETRRDVIGPAGGRRVSRTYAPRLEFVDGNGATHTVTSSLSGGVRPAVGSTVRVSYLPARPEQARILGDAHTRVGRYLLLVIGLGFIAITVALSLTRR
ncbi:MAG: hypothetical protein QOG98_590 [Pseudonocardiales bacterium]|nr:hypothetical protein [Pseudonocardiales bacterium]